MKIFNILYYVLTFTWGLFTNICGAVVALAFMFLFDAKVSIKHGRFVFIGGERWGGLSLGNFVFICKTSSACGDDTLNHEIGHSIQNMLWGPLFFPIIGIPSAIRCRYRETKYYKKHTKVYKPYDAIWFEGQATAWGNKYVKALEKK